MLERFVRRLKTEIYSNLNSWKKFSTFSKAAGL